MCNLFSFLFNGVHDIFETLPFISSIMVVYIDSIDVTCMTLSDLQLELNTKCDH